MNITFIGGGNMASAMIGGMLLNGTCKPMNIRVVEIDESARQRHAEQGVGVFPVLERLAIEGAEVVVLAVKPQVMKEVAQMLGPLLAGRQVVLSIAAGIRLPDLARWLGHADTGFALVRAMPNTPSLVNAGMTGLYSARLDDTQRQGVEEIMRATGAFLWLGNEKDLDAVTAISGSGPAYFFYFIEALMQAGLELGLAEAAARTLALETALGAAKLAHDSPEPPSTLRARVTSKNGTTERALLSMESDRVKAHIAAAAHAAAERAREMGDELGAA